MRRDGSAIESATTHVKLLCVVEDGRVARVVALGVDEALIEVDSDLVQRRVLDWRWRQKSAVVCEEE